MAAASPSSAPSRRLTEPRYSRAASALIAEHALTGVDFDVDFVTTREVRAHLGMPQLVPAPPPAATPRKTPELVSGSKAGRAVENRKRSEIDALTRGAGDTMLSVLGVTLGPLEIRRAAGDFLAGSITDLVIYEASRLMKKYPTLNAAYADGYVVEHEAIHAGMAIDGGGKLVVYGIENANRLEMQELSNAMADAVERYTNNALTSAEMTRATFTVTDLSADELDFIFPLLPRGQSCILGITHSAAGGFRIFAGFDHRVTEGREIAAFLGELRTRLLTFAAAQKAAAPAANCGYCGRSADEAVKGKEKGLLKVIVRDGGEVLCCASCWSGW
jgi:2-oxoglutarate dehydrogenase E2 component (dihydrolipoamide succinyltransferase)